MNTPIKFFGLLAGALVTVSWIATSPEVRNVRLSREDSLRKLYSRPVSQWPRPDIDKGIAFRELGAMPYDSSWLLVDRDPVIKLGQVLFFDPRLSSSNQISCSSCHDPEIGWGDGRRVSLGHDHLPGSRNTPTLLNVAIHRDFFWDGRSGSLEDQAIAPLSAHHEMNMETPLLAEKIDGIAGYKEYFKKAYGDERVTLDRILGAIAKFESIIKSRQTRFDEFVRGKYTALSDKEISGLHLFRTKARCMNCHYGTFFTDQEFHNIGLTYYGRKYQDLGRYEVTKDPKDVGKFRTPTLRDVMKTNPWMHNGLFDNITGVINIYNSGMHQLDEKSKDKSDSLYPKTDPILRPLNLTEAEKADLVAFLEAITATQYKMRRPELPK
ncbi:MAG: cytochrome c peroxidase [Candidatus Pseudobacter hemicellulosilyticus]|uniref:Cytochrome c peroxidase n=1 Tax=Candidatus Pseudobacter hemicellulosilyticus TaxID=3121375 RepID=A0AAJ5WS68_9BACT|nr:MAG: cytochrome c peroxidase [Pseudobacter sp.]